jgi:hypothetical protein
MPASAERAPSGLDLSRRLSSAIVESFAACGIVESSKVVVFSSLGVVIGWVWGWASMSLPFLALLGRSKGKSFF